MFDIYKIMFLLIFKWVIISLTLIFLAHHLYMFLMNTLTIPKIKDLVNKPNEQYREIYDTMHMQPGDKKSTSQSVSNSISNSVSISANNSVSLSNNNAMAEELSLFLNDLKKSPQKDDNLNSQKKTDIEFYAANQMGGNGFSAY